MRQSPADRRVEDGRQCLVDVGIFARQRFGDLLVAVRFAPVGYVAVLRESSIVIGAYAGWVFLGESLGGRRLRASLVITAGLLALVLLR